MMPVKILAFFIIAVLFSSCISSSLIFQDGKTLGKDTLEIAVSLSYTQSPLYKVSDTSLQVLVLTNERVAFPWAQANVQYGLFKRLDIGAGVGVGFLSYGGQAFVKYALLPKEKKAGIALMAMTGYTEADLTDDDDSNNPFAAKVVRYFAMTYAAPISFPLGQRTTMLLTPQYSTERLTLLPVSDKPNVPDRIREWYDSFKLGVGMRFHMHRGKLDVNLVTGYYQPASNAMATSLGFAYHFAH